MCILSGEDILARVLAGVVVFKFVYTSRLEFSISPTCDYILNIFSLCHADNQKFHGVFCLILSYLGVVWIQRSSDCTSYCDPQKRNHKFDLKFKSTFKTSDQQEAVWVTIWQMVQGLLQQKTQPRRAYNTTAKRGPHIFRILSSACRTHSRYHISTCPK